MRSLGGFILLLAGIGLALFVYLPAPVDSIVPSRNAQLSPAKLTPVSRLTSFSPSIALTTRLTSFSPSIALTMPARGGPFLPALRPRRLPHRHCSRRKRQSPATRSQAGRQSLPSQRLRRPRRRNRRRLARATLRPATTSYSTSSGSCGASAAIGTAWTARGASSPRMR